MLRSGLLIALTAVAVAGVASSSAVAGNPEPTAAAGLLASGSVPAGAAPTRPSTPQELAVSDHLRRRGALFYGAWWCPACLTQKRLFGRQAAARLPYVECDKSDAGRQRCRKAQVQSIPTWDLHGRRLEGVQSVETLKRWSGFPTSRAAGK
jgi:hypothetical protein